MHAGTEVVPSNVRRLFSTRRRNRNWKQVGSIGLVFLTVFTNLLSPWATYAAPAQDPAPATVAQDPVPASAAQDPISAPNATAEGVFGSPKTIPGQLDSNTGAMTWSYPFYLPAARGRPQPQLALTYNSFARDQEAGYGWGLNLPVIEFRPLSGNPCFTQNGTPFTCGDPSAGTPNLVSVERYAYNGQPLVFLCMVSGSQAVDDDKCGKEPQPEWTKPKPEWSPDYRWRYFRLQSGGQSMRFYLSPDRRYWQVQLKGGELFTFGEPPNSPTPGIERAFDNHNAFLRWRLVRHADGMYRNGGEPLNYVDYRWKRLGSRGLLYLTDIYDTPLAAGQAGDAGFAHHTQLTWQPPNFLQTSYADPYHAAPDLRLARIAVASMDWDGRAPREIQRTYKLHYLPAQGSATLEPLSQVFYPWHHSFLAEIAVEGRCSQFENDRGDAPSSGECPADGHLPSTTFEYEDGHPAFGIAQFTQLVGGPPNAADQGRVLPYLNSVGLVDFNRDGLPDVVQGWDSEYCPDDGVFGDLIDGSIRISPLNSHIIPNDVIYCAYNIDGEIEYRPILSSRPIIGYINQGVNSQAIKLAYQCMDAGTGSDPSGLTFYNRELFPGFFSAAGATTLVGSWGSGVLAWSNAGYAPYLAKPLIPTYDLKVTSMPLPAAGKSLVAVEKIGDGYHVRIFDSQGNLLIDKGPDEFKPAEALAFELNDVLDKDLQDRGNPANPQDQQRYQENFRRQGEVIQQITTNLHIDLPFEPGSGCDPEHFDADTFRPGWKWEKGLEADWAKKPVISDNPAQHYAPRWFTDVDGDGLIDRLGDSGTEAFDFNASFVEYTQRYAENERLPELQGHGPAQVPFVDDLNQAQPRSFAPSVEGARRGTRYYYVDINGDGLVDLVTVNAVDNGGIPRVRPGDGRGSFGCNRTLQPWDCHETTTEPMPFYEVTGAGALLPWPFTQDTYFHDVTADGLADILQYDMASGEVRLWVNQDGRAFACAIPSCLAGKVIKSESQPVYDIGDHRVTFADMNADGTEDIVILAHHGIYVGTFMHKHAPVTDYEHGMAPRPGLLTRVHNGYGATTDIRYQTIQQLDLQAQGTPFAYREHSPVVESVVTRITTRDDYHAGGNLNDLLISEPYDFKRIVDYVYQDPAYDRWSRSFAGFRKVVSHSGDEVATTASTYWFGPCQDNTQAAQLPWAPNIPPCLKGSDNDKYKSLAGRVARVDRSNGYLDDFSVANGRFNLENPPQGPSLLWSKTFQYSLPIPYDRPDRQVSFAYPSQIDTYQYDETKPTQPAGPLPVLAGVPNPQCRVLGGGYPGDPLVNAPHQTGIRKHLCSVVEYDTRGTLKRVTEYGAVKDDDSPPADPADAVTITLFSFIDPDNSVDTPAVLPCNGSWQCLPGFVSTWEPQPTLGGNNQDELLRKSRFAYEPATGAVLSVDGWLIEPAAPLQRRHPAGAGSTAPPPLGQSLAQGWHNLGSFDYDAWGNVVQMAGGQTFGGSPAACTGVTYDEPYHQLPQFRRSYLNGCGSASLETETVFDRGFEQVARFTGPNGSASAVDYDPFGRPLNLYLPDPDALPGAQPPVVAATIAYGDRKPLSYVDTRQFYGSASVLRSVTLLNGLGESVLTFDQGDNNDWLVNGWNKLTLTGQVDLVRRPWAYTGDPIDTAVNAKVVTVPPDNGYFQMAYDGFGRQASLMEQGNGFAQELLRTTYFPLAIETRDAEQLDPAGPHAKAYQRVEYDGRGHSIRSTAHIETPALNNIVTAVQYDPLGLPVAITRMDATSAYRRSLEYDSLGRLVANKEPNTGNGWRYVWDDSGRLVGTSDARGCGENFFYDGLDRMLGEDYSPCLDSQPAYTPPNLETGAGLETFYRFDSYEDNQVSPEPGFNDDGFFAIGNLVSVSDRGSHTRFNYDARGQVRRVARQMVKPAGQENGTPYAPHWFTARTDYDLGGRVVRQTTGADIEELLMNGGSEERYTYSPSGALFSLDTSYGSIIKSMTYDPEGAPTQVVYGDNRGTTASLIYDKRHRLSQYRLMTTIGYFLTLQKYFDYHYTYDSVGNPLVIENSSFTAPLTPTPPATVSRQVMGYDDLYRLTRIDNTYGPGGGGTAWTSPFANEISAGDHHPAPLSDLPTRIAWQTFAFDSQGNLTASADDLQARYDRSLGANLGYGAPQSGPNQLLTAGGIRARYDEAGNLVELKVERPGACSTGAASQCAQWYAYDWDEVGQLTRARRWDFDGNTLPAQAGPGTPPQTPAWELSYAYSQGTRVLKSTRDGTGSTQLTLDVFDTLRIGPVNFNPAGGDYLERRSNVHVYPGGMAHVFWDGDGLLPHQSPTNAITMNLILGDHLGSSSVIINHATSELVERTTYQPYGALESDYRPDKWKASREPYKFTGKEEDIEVGAVYFGARYYQPYLGRFMSADPLTIQGLGGDLNPYAYVGGRVTTQIDRWGLEEGPVLPDPGTTIVTACNPCKEDNPPLPADFGMNWSRAEGMATQAGSRRLERLSRNGNSSVAAGGSAGRGNWFGMDEAATETMRQADGTPDPDWMRGRERAGEVALTVLVYRAGISAVVAADSVFANVLLRLFTRRVVVQGAAAGVTAGAVGSGSRGCSAGSGCSALRFGANDLVYGPSAKGALRQLQQQAGGKLLTDMGDKPPGISWLEFSIDTLRQQVGRGGAVRFDLTYVEDLPGILAGTGSFANTVTAGELRFIQQNWGMFQNFVFFYRQGVQVGAPW